VKGTAFMGFEFYRHEESDQLQEWGGQVREPSRAASFTRVSMNDERNVRYWTQLLGCSEDELAAAVARTGNSPDAVRREVYRHWAYGTFGKAPLKHKRHHGG
jgi:hypothetical protein